MFLRLHKRSRYCSSATRTSCARVRTLVLAKSCCSVFLMVLSETSMRRRYFLVGQSLNQRAKHLHFPIRQGCPFVTVRKEDRIGAVRDRLLCDVRDDRGKLRRRPSLYVENHTSAVNDSPFPRWPRHCIDARNWGASSHRRAWCSSGQERRDGIAGQFSVPRRHQLDRGLIGEFDEAALIDGHDRRRTRFDQRLQSFPSFQGQAGGCAPVRQRTVRSRPAPASQKPNERLTDRVN